METFLKLQDQKNKLATPATTNHEADLNLPSDLINQTKGSLNKTNEETSETPIIDYTSSNNSNKKKIPKVDVLSGKEKETPFEKIEKFKSYFQSPTLNRAFGEFMNMNLKNLREVPLTEKIEVQIKPFVMGICGGTSAGKSQIVKMIVKSLTTRKTDKITFLSEENFFMSKAQHPQDETVIDYDHPTNVDWEMFTLALDTLIERRKFEIPLFDMDSEDRKKERKLLEPTDLIIVEGRLVFYDERIRSKCDLKIFLDTDEDIRLSRRVYKDVLVRKKKVVDVIDRYLKFIKPDFEKFVLPSKKYADIIIPNYGGGFSNELPEDGGDNDEIGFNHFDHAAVGLIIDQVHKKVKKIKEFRVFTDLNNKIIKEQD